MKPVVIDMDTAILLDILCNRTAMVLPTAHDSSYLYLQCLTSCTHNRFGHVQFCETVFDFVVRVFKGDLKRNKD